MNGEDIKLAVNAGVELRPTTTPGIFRAVVSDAGKRFDLSWDRFCRLYRTAEAIKQRIERSDSVIDVGGFDGALALFLTEHQLDVIDPITTGGSHESVTADSYDVVVSIDALEHVSPDQRQLFLEQLSSAARHWCFINFPGRHTAKAQELAYELTNNPLVKEHVMWQLPDVDDVKERMERLGFRVETDRHTGLSQWISQYLLQTVASSAAAKANRYLLTHHLDEPVGTHLYELVIGRKIPHLR